MNGENPIDWVRNWVTANFFRRSAFTDTGGTAKDGGRPVRLDAGGKVGASVVPALTAGQVIGESTYNATSIEVGINKLADSGAFVDLHAENSGARTYADYALRMIRNSGTNGTAQVQHRGTGAFQIITVDAAALQIATNNTVRMTVAAGGVVDFAAAPTVGGAVVWHAGNDGAGSTLDADLLDGLDSLAFVKADGTVAMTDVFRVSDTGDNNYFKMAPVTALTLASTAVAVLPTQVCMVLVVGQSTGYVGMFFLRGSGNTAYEVLDPANQHSVTAGTAGTNVYWSAGNSRYEIENRTGSSRNYSIFILGPVGMT